MDQEAPISDWEESSNVGRPDDPTGESNPVEASLTNDGEIRQAPSSQRSDPRGPRTRKPAAAAAPAAPAAPIESQETTEGEEPDPADAEAAERGRDARGRFRRKRSPAQAARPEDAPRIQQLTGRLRETERRLKEAEARAAGPATAPRAAAPAPTVARPAAPAPAPPALRKFEKARPTRPVLETFQRAEPDADPSEVFKKYEAALGKYDADVDAWRDEKADFDAEERVRADRVRQESEKITESWRGKVAAAEKKYPNFRKVAIDAPTRIPEGSLVDAWIMEHKYGADVLYHLQLPANEAELDDLLAMSPIEQAEALTLLGQRLNTATRPAADASTGSPAAEPRPRTTAPRPLNPVRTGGPTARASEQPPGDDASLEDHERFFGSRPRDRRRTR